MSGLIRPERCENCKFVVKEGGQHVCRRYPPAAHIAMTNKGPQPISTYPLVMSEHWCGDYQRKVALDG